MRSSAVEPATGLLVVIVAMAAMAVVADAAAQTVSSPPATIWDGVFTAEQARRGQVAYTGPCDRCHGYKLDGAPEDPVMLPAPPVAGSKFLRKWSGRSLAALFEYTRATMPSNNPGYLSERDVADIIAFMLAASDAPAGTEVLQPNTAALGSIAIVPRPR
jgi:S-disulfanyl-L-cysteine oxidoreductase SoxD